MGSERLDDIAFVEMGQSPPGDTCNRTADGLPLLNGPTEFGPRHPSAVQFTTDPRKQARPGDLLFCVRGATAGRMNWADQTYAIGRGIAALRHRAGPAYQPFLRAVVEWGLPSLLVQATGVIFPNISRQQLASLPVPRMSLPEQRAIAHILGTLDEKIELNRRQNETLEEMAQALFKSWFVDFDPVWAKAEGRSPVGMDAETAALFPAGFEESEVGLVPEGWGVGALRSVVDVLSGGTPKTTVADYWDGDIPWFTPKDAPGDGEVFAIDTERHVTAGGIENSATQVLPRGSTIITARGTVGKLALVGMPMALNQSCYGLRGREAYPDYFVYFLVRASVTALQQQTHGAIFDTITMNTFDTVKAVLPPNELGAAFDQAVGTWLDRILLNLRLNQTLAATRDALLPKLMSGEVLTLETVSNHVGDQW